MANGRIEFREFLLSDLHAIDVQPRHAHHIAATVSSVHALLAMSCSTPAFTMLEGGKVKACCGAFNGELWAFLAADMKTAMLPLVRYGLKLVKQYGACRADIDNNDPNAIRLARLAGFRPLSHGYWNIV